ncbi:MAG: hypothetical protein IKQ90_08070 [Ruminococcus sp.]|jgi:Na+/glutamate symporter|nr:hypothetical protein [Ruminococcus sp.]
MGKGKVIIAAATVTIVTAGITAATVIVCRRLFEKNYFTSAENSLR